MLLACPLMSLSACGIPKLRGPAPAPCIPQDFNGVTTPDNSAQLGTHEFFADPNLLSLIDQALVGNQQLRILAEDIEIANNEVQRRRGSLFPFISAGTSAGIEKNSLYTPQGAADAQAYVSGRQLPGAVAQLHGRRGHLVADRYLATTT
ncbi:MAG: hypothetical protein QM811_31720 [Pirellulales bacterium]